MGEIWKLAKRSATLSAPCGLPSKWILKVGCIFKTLQHQSAAARKPPLERYAANCGPASSRPRSRLDLLHCRKSLDLSVATWRQSQTGPSVAPFKLAWPPILWTPSRSTIRLPKRRHCLQLSGMNRYRFLARASVSTRSRPTSSVLLPWHSSVCSWAAAWPSLRFLGLVRLADLYKRLCCRGVTTWTVQDSDQREKLVFGPPPAHATFWIVAVNV